MAHLKSEGHVFWRPRCFRIFLRGATKLPFSRTQIWAIAMPNWGIKSSNTNFSTICKATGCQVESSIDVPLLKLSEISGHFPISLYLRSDFYGRKKVLNSWHKYIISPHLDHESPREGCGEHPTYSIPGNLLPWHGWGKIFSPGLKPGLALRPHHAGVRDILQACTRAPLYH